MSHHTGWTLLSLTLASTSLLALTTMLASGGCGQDTDGFYAKEGDCTVVPNADPCTKVVSCQGQHIAEPLPDRTACTLKGRAGTCELGACSTPCSSPSDCLPPTQCSDWSCHDGKCAKAPLPPPGDGNSCTDDQCIGDEPSYVPKQLGEACEGMKGVCDDTTMPPQCVECILGTTMGCPAGEICFDLNGIPTCTKCNDTTKNGDETDVDCGGTCATCINDGPCKKCKLGQVCGELNGNCDGLPCVDKICCENSCGADCKMCETGTGKCIDVLAGKLDTCMDSKVCVPGSGCKLNQGQTCTSNSDCMSGDCTSMKCAKSDIGEPCVSNTDCMGSSICNAMNVCQ
jgi:hypothetical protein